MKTGSPSMFIGTASPDLGSANRLAPLSLGPCSWSQLLGYQPRKAFLTTLSVVYRGSNLDLRGVVAQVAVVYWGKLGIVRESL